jgi:hypothetical protein
MAGARLGAALRQIQWLFSDGSAAGASDTGEKIAGGSIKIRIELTAHPQAQPQARSESPLRQKSAQKYTITGMVIGPDGEPLAGATVFWVGHPRFDRIANAMPIGFKEKPEDFIKTLARASTGAAGRFELAAEFDAHQFPARAVVVTAKGAGVSGRTFLGDSVRESAGNDERLEFRLRKPVTIEGRLLSLAGAPAKGVKVTLESLRDGKNELENDEITGGRLGAGDEFRSDYWPKAWTTDNDGRFRIEGVVPEKMFARLSFRHPDFADDDLLVSTGPPVDGSPLELDVKSVDARFTHALEPARPVTGIVTDKETGRSLAGVLVRMVPARTTPRFGGNGPDLVRTDATGRYRAAGASGETYWVTAFPDPGSGYLPLLMRDKPWPVGSKILNVDLPLPKGRVIRGHVVEGNEGRPVVGASVIYQPGQTNPLDSGHFDFDNPILTDKSGEFALTALPGPGLLAVEGPTSDFIRAPVIAPGMTQPSLARPHGFAWIDLPAAKDTKVAEARLALRKGVKLEARIVGPDDLPVDMAMGWWAEMLASQLENWVSPGPIPDGRFQLEGADPQRTYRVFLVHPQAQARRGRGNQVRPERTGCHPASADGHRQGNHG